MSVCRSVLATIALASFGAAPVSSTQSPASFPKAEMMTVGVYYYPEAWPREQWERDFANIRKHGFEFVHMAEFAWAFMEPQEGRFDFEWLERAVRLAAAQGLKVVLCTPSATPPAWLTRAHPETLMIDARGRRMNHGSREHATWSSPRLPSICRANRDRAWPAIRTQSERVGLADRQRTEPLRPLVFLRTGEPGEVSRLAARPVQDDRCAEPRGETPSGRRCTTTSRRSTSRIPRSSSRR